MDYKRILTTIIGLPIVSLILIFGNRYLVDIAISIIAIMSLHEYFHSFKGKANPIRWVGYIAALFIAVIHIIPSNMVLGIIAALIPLSILILFTNVISSNNKINIQDIAITFFGICYIPLFLLFIPIIRDINGDYGRILIWFVFIAAWGTDVFAYIIGKTLGKHKFLEISPNKTIEGCIGGMIGACILMLGYACLCNNIWNMELSYWYTGLIAIILSIIGQIGDLAASSIKRFVGIKDFSNLIPGHGGMLDRIDSVIFIAPFAYFLLTLLIL